MCSFSEGIANRFSNLCGEEYVNHNKRFLSRVFPNPNRVDSSNYNPQDLWNSGCQIGRQNYTVTFTNIPCFFNTNRIAYYFETYLVFIVWNVVVRNWKRVLSFISLLLWSDDTYPYRWHNVCMLLLVYGDMSKKWNRVVGIFSPCMHGCHFEFKMADLYIFLQGSKNQIEKHVILFVWS